MRCFPWSLGHLKTWCRVWLFGKDEERGLIGGRYVTGVGLGFQKPYAIPRALSLLVVCGLGCELSDAAQHHACLLPCILPWQWWAPIPWTIHPKWTLPSLSCLGVLSQQHKSCTESTCCWEGVKMKGPMVCQEGISCWGTMGAWGNPKCLWMPGRWVYPKLWPENRLAQDKISEVEDSNVHQGLRSPISYVHLCE